MSETDEERMTYRWLTDEIAELRQRLAASEAACAMTRLALEAEQAFWKAVEKCPNCDPETGSYCEEEHQDEFERMEKLKRNALKADAGLPMLAALAAARALDDAIVSSPEQVEWSLVDDLQDKLAALDKGKEQADG